MTLRIALAGTGGIAAVHAQAICQLDEVELAAVVTTRADGAADFRARYQIPKAYPSTAELLVAEQLDALVVCTPNALHARQTTLALLAGVHVLVEKPMALNAGEAEGMLRASQASGSLLMVAFCHRFDAEVQWLAAQARAGRLGEIVRTKSYGVHVGWGPSGWFSDPALSGGGALIDMGVHAIDTTRFLLGSPQPASVFARLGTYYEDIPVDDTGVLLVTWADGTVSYIECGWNQPHADGPEGATQLYGTQGFATLAPAEMQLRSSGEVITERPDLTPAEIEESQMYLRQMAYFCDCIRSGTQPIPSGEDGWVVAKITDAAYTERCLGSSGADRIAAA